MATDTSATETGADALAHLRWDERGLLPAVVQDAHTGGVRMLAWMNADALRATLRTGFAHFYSRSRQALWKKGESSGNTLAVREVRTDCDSDAIVIVAEPAGPTCHTGASSCFYRVLGAGEPAGASPGASAAERQSGPGAGPGAGADAKPEATIIREDDGPADPLVAVLARLERVLVARRDQSTAEKSYTRSLLDGGFPRILAKIAEEHGELAEVLPAGDAADVVHESADLLFHVFVGLAARRIPLDDVWRELGRRFGTSGHTEKASRGSGTT
jgi:phosphoribosyl-ATP pyrophosphohydrolase/phosphoribosyl-AMP cyclohydrolase